ncbi:MAG: hypothetical protein NUW37_14510 [Planctomycetes bacterium]|nr:hypothetical protein [Planctomycetota bacterium]
MSNIQQELKISLEKFQKGEYVASIRLLDKVLEREDCKGATRDKVLIVRSNVETKMKQLGLEMPASEDSGEQVQAGEAQAEEPGSQREKESPPSEADESKIPATEKISEPSTASAAENETTTNAPESPVEVKSDSPKEDESHHPKKKKKKKKSRDTEEDDSIKGKKKKKKKKSREIEANTASGGPEDIGTEETSKDEETESEAALPLAAAKSSGGFGFDDDGFGEPTETISADAGQIQEEPAREQVAPQNSEAEASTSDATVLGESALESTEEVVGEEESLPPESTATSGSSFTTASSSVTANDLLRKSESEPSAALSSRWSAEAAAGPRMETVGASNLESSLNESKMQDGESEPETDEDDSGDAKEDRDEDDEPRSMEEDIEHAKYEIQFLEKKLKDHSEQFATMTLRISELEKLIAAHQGENGSGAKIPDDAEERIARLEAALKKRDDDEAELSILPPRLVELESRILSIEISGDGGSVSGVAQEVQNALVAIAAARQAWESKLIAIEARVNEISKKSGMRSLSYEEMIQAHAEELKKKHELVASVRRALEEQAERTQKLTDAETENARELKDRLENEG